MAVYNWIKEFGEKLGELKSDTRIKVLETDEMHSYVGQKNITVGSGSLLIEIGENSSIALLAGEIRKPEKSYGGSLKSKRVSSVMTDHCKAVRGVCSSGETSYPVEGRNIHS